MKELATALGVIAGTSLLQACGGSDGSTSSLDVKVNRH